MDIPTRIFLSNPHPPTPYTLFFTRIHLPASELFEWLEIHTQIRLSILLTWLFSRSPLFNAALRALRAAAGLIAELLSPLTAALAVALSPLASALAAATAFLHPIAAALAVTVTSILSLALTVARASASAVSGILVPPIALATSVLHIASQVLSTMVGILQVVLSGPLVVVSSAWITLSSLGSETMKHLKSVGLFFK